MPRRPEAVRAATLAALAVVATGLALAGTVEGAGDSVARTAAKAWHGVFGDRPKAGARSRSSACSSCSARPRSPTGWPRAEQAPTAKQQRSGSPQAEGAQQLLLASLRERAGRRRARPDLHADVQRLLRRSSARARSPSSSAPATSPASTRCGPSTPPLRPRETIVGRDFRPGQGPGAGVTLPGFSGKGVTIAVLDTGVDRGHAYLRGRVLRGFDVVDGDRDAGAGGEAGRARRRRGARDAHGGPARRPRRPLRARGRGARCAGAPHPRHGLAQTADGGWAVLGRGDLLLAGLERAVDPDADGDVDDGATIALAAVVEPYAAFADSPESRAVAGATQLGTLVVAPAGNDGRPGPGFGSVGAPAAAPDALAVGTLDTRRAGAPGRCRADRRLRRGPGRAGARARHRRPRRADSGSRSRPGRPDALPAGPRGGRRGDAGTRSPTTSTRTASASSPAGPSWCRRTTARSSAKSRNAAAAGAAALLVSGTNLPAGALDVEDGVGVPVLAVPGDAGDEALLRRRRPRSLRVPSRSRTSSLMDVAAFSSGGLAFDGRVKPDLVAPGVGLATADAGGQGFATVTGSSAAAAVVAGAAALVAEARPSLSAAELRSALVGSGGRLTRNDLALPVTAQGGGLVDPAPRSTAELAVEPATLAFGRADGPGWSATRAVTVRNVSSRPLVVLRAARRRAGGAHALLLGRPGQADAAAGRGPGRHHRRRRRRGHAGGRGRGHRRLRDGRPAGPHPVGDRAPQADRAPLVGDVQLSHTEFSPSDLAPVVLAFRAGRADRALDGEMIEPVGLLELELWTAEGRRLGVLARMRDVLPGPLRLRPHRARPGREGRSPRARTSFGCGRIRSTATTARRRPPPRPSSRSSASGHAGGHSFAPEGRPVGDGAQPASPRLRADRDGRQHAERPLRVQEGGLRLGPDADGRRLRAGVRGVPGHAQRRARALQGRDPLPPRCHLPRDEGARHVDDLEVRAHGPSLRRRQGRRRLRPEAAVRTASSSA